MDAMSTALSSAVVHLGLDPDTKEVVARWCVRGSGAGPTFPFAEAASVPTPRLFGPARQKSQPIGLTFGGCRKKSVASAAPTSASGAATGTDTTEAVPPAPDSCDDSVVDYHLVQWFSDGTQTPSASETTSGFR